MFVASIVILQDSSLYGDPHLKLGSGGVPRGRRKSYGGGEVTGVTHERLLQTSGGCFNVGPVFKILSSSFPSVLSASKLGRSCKVLMHKVICPVIYQVIRSGADKSLAFPIFYLLHKQNNFSWMD
jgi:hypothetical protein